MSRNANTGRLSLKSDRTASVSPLDQLDTSNHSTPYVDVEGSTSSLEAHYVAHATNSPIVKPTPLPHADLTPLQRPIQTLESSKIPFLHLDRVGREDVVTPIQRPDVRSPAVISTQKKLAIATLHHSSEGEVTPGRTVLQKHAFQHATNYKDDINVALAALSASSRPAAGSEGIEALESIAKPSVITHIGDIQSLIIKTYHQDKTSPESSGWQFLFDSKPIKGTLGYYGQVWINQTKKEVVLVSSGTKIYFSEFEGSSLTNLYGAWHLVKDLINDVQLFANSAPSQYKGVRKFIDLMISKLGEHNINPKDYQVIFAGHSLGAITSDMGMLYARTEYDLEAHSLTMESPGSLPSMTILSDKMKKYGKLPLDFNLSSVEKYCTVVNNEANWINTACKQFGKVYKNLVREYKTLKLPKFCDYLPSSIKDLLAESLRQNEYHSKEHFALGGIPDMELQETWPVGLFKTVLVEKIANAVTSFESVILGSPIFSSLFLDAVKLVKTLEKKSFEAKEKVLAIYAEVKHDTEEFLDYIQSYDEIGGIGNVEEDIA